MAEAYGYRPPAITGLVDVLDRQVREHPHALALVATADRIPVTYGALAAMVDGVATHLKEMGLQPADPVALVCPNQTEFVVGLLGAARAGLVIAPMDPALPGPELSERLEEVGARAVLACATTVPHVDGPVWTLRVDVAGTVTLDTGEPLARRVRGAGRELTGEDALVLFTAGTTDRAKLVPLTHTNVAASVRGICAGYELGPDDATVAAMPFFHGHGLFAVLLSTLATGGSVLLPARGRFSAHTFWDDVEDAAATWFTAVPTIYEILVSRAAHDFPRAGSAPLRFVRSCSAPLNAATHQAVERVLGVPLLSAYGMTETTHQTASEPLPERGPHKHGSVGRATGVALRLLDQNGLAVPAGAEGEVWVGGPTVAREYLSNPIETAHSFAGGWFRTGDLGRLDDDGYLFLTGRLKNLINRGGEKIAPEHVEDVLAGCPGVVEAAVFAVPDAVYGERVGAAVVVAGNTGAGEILRYCRTRLAAFEVPDRVDIVPALPHTAKGAIDRRALDARYAR
jgi:acyl-CoA synthetase (AMP-forming)/AMP-acid ligase II